MKIFVGNNNDVLKIVTFLSSISEATYHNAERTRVTAIHLIGRENTALPSQAAKSVGDNSNFLCKWGIWCIVGYIDKNGRQRVDSLSLLLEIQLFIIVLSGKETRLNQ